MAEQEGRLAVDEAGHEIYYRLFGEGPETLVGLHGGPGSTTRYRRGSASSPATASRFSSTTSSGAASPTSRRRFAVGRPALRRGARDRPDEARARPRASLGQSWGGFLALQYALDHPAGVKSLVLSNTGSSTAEVFRGMTQLSLDLGADEFTQMAMHEGRATWRALSTRR